MWGRGEENVEAPLLILIGLTGSSPAGIPDNTHSLILYE